MGGAAAVDQLPEADSLSSVYASSSVVCGFVAVVAVAPEGALEVDAFAVFAHVGVDGALVDVSAVVG